MRPTDDLRPPPTTEFSDIDEARRELEEAGFDDLQAGPDELIFAWSRGGYLEFKESYDEYDLFESLSEADRSRMRDRLQVRWSDLPDAAFSVRGPLVWATARRPAVG